MNYIWRQGTSERRLVVKDSEKNWRMQFILHAVVRQKDTTVRRYSKSRRHTTGQQAFTLNSQWTCLHFCTIKNPDIYFRKGCKNTFVQGMSFGWKAQFLATFYCKKCSCMTQTVCVYYIYWNNNISNISWSWIYKSILMPGFHMIASIASSQSQQSYC